MVFHGKLKSLLTHCSSTHLFPQHYGPDTYNKNFIYRFDDWLLSARWTLLITHRDSVDFVEVITWNDYGESHYIGPIEGAQPMSQGWTTGFDHTGTKSNSFSSSLHLNLHLKRSVVGSRAILRQLVQDWNRASHYGRQGFSLGTTIPCRSRCSR